ncbi:alpha/beta hydrolase [Aquibium sp. A9E412]|uniref:alpha/beta hydrolase n=1 Tax=Aquibium sp. A9E412 TaxID=2976767 RepID=UPI0025AF95D6|nr:CocE/NonD family hydrolase [Aquibium sp. A9E412]MDN2567606.1 alpha/beta hydrolase [Aquibium sp. A9E412]
MEKVEFKSQGETLKGVLTRPQNASGDVPLVVMAGGWCYTKEVVMPHYARFFNDIGCATLYFDYRNFGESAGERRQHLDPWMQIEDYQNAFSFAETLDGIDIARSGYWGISYSGGHSIILASIDPRAAFAISTVPVVDGFQTMRRCHGERRFAELNKLVMDDRRKRYRGEAGDTMAMSPKSDPSKEMSAWPFPHVHAGFMGIKQNEAPLHEHWNTVESVELLMRYVVKPYAERIIETPVMVALAKADNITSADLEIEIFNAIACVDKELAVVRGVDHMSLYTNTEHLAKIAKVQADWLKDTLARI